CRDSTNWKLLWMSVLYNTVSILFAEVNPDAAIRIEQLWKELAMAHSFVLHCVYPVHGFYFFFSSRRRHKICYRDWSSDVCSSDLHRHGRRQEGRGRTRSCPLRPRPSCRRPWR